MVRLLKDFISLFFPRACIGCKKILITSEIHICLHCRLSLPLFNNDSGSNNKLKNKLSSIEGLNQTFSYLIYNKTGIAQKLLKKLKYEGVEEIGYLLGLWMGYEIINEVGDIDLIIPVPLHIDKLRKRGYNQSDSICKGLSEALVIPVEYNLIKRTKFNPTQTKKTKVDRWLNVEKLFELNSQLNLQEKHIMIVDDVITTGATIESVAKILSISGVKKISVACLASGQ